LWRFNRRVPNKYRKESKKGKRLWWLFISLSFSNLFFVIIKFKLRKWTIRNKLKLKISKEMSHSL
jgi:hypothetical protein